MQMCKINDFEKSKELSKNLEWINIWKCVLRSHNGKYRFSALYSSGYIKFYYNVKNIAKI